MDVRVYSQGNQTVNVLCVTKTLFIVNLLKKSNLFLKERGNYCQMCSVSEVILTMATTTIITVSLIFFHHMCLARLRELFLNDTDCTETKRHNLQFQVNSELFKCFSDTLHKLEAMSFYQYVDRWLHLNYKINHAEKEVTHISTKVFSFVYQQL